MITMTCLTLCTSPSAKAGFGTNSRSARGRNRSARVLVVDRIIDTPLGLTAGGLILSGRGQSGTFPGDTLELRPESSQSADTPCCFTRPEWLKRCGENLVNDW